MNFRKHLFACCAITCLMMVAFLPDAFTQTIRYVKPTASGTGNGSSWANASSDLQAMINASAAGHEVWVAAGLYKPSRDPFGNSNPANPRDKTFFIKDGVKLYGGFAGTEANIGQRNIDFNISMLSGDIDNNGIPDPGNAYHVVLASAPAVGGTGVVIDGFTITGGYSKDLDFSNYSIVVNGNELFADYGAGIYIHNGANIITNNSISQNAAGTGGGIYAENSSSIILDNIFSLNSAYNEGGGIYHIKGNFTLSNNSFLSNSAYRSGGGIVCAEGASNVLTNNIISGNSSTNGSAGGISIVTGTYLLANNKLTGNAAALAGGGIAVVNASIDLVNNILYGNTAFYGGAVQLLGSNTRLYNNSLSGNRTSFPGEGVIVNAEGFAFLRNNIIWGNSGGFQNSDVGIATSDIQYCLVQGLNSGVGNLNVDPVFEQQPPIGLGTAGNLKLQACSPAINKGIFTIELISVTTDIDGNARIFGGTIDMGAYELQVPPITAGSILYVNAAATGTNNGTSWNNAFTELQTALSLAASCNAVKEIWVAKGTYKPTTTTDRNISFALKNGLALYGGFAGNETLLSQRNLAGDATILSGEIQGDNNPQNNTYSLFRNANIDGTAILDGFTLSGAASNTGGGAMFNNNASPTIRNCIFQSNSAVTIGGVLYNNNSNPAFTNCLFYGNTGVGFGWLIANAESAPTFINCTFANNISSEDPAFFGESNSMLTLTNCIVWGNSGLVPISNSGTSTVKVTHTLIQGGFAGIGNQDGNPFFKDANADNFQLLYCSPAINAGTAENAPVIDILGAARPLLGTHDMGAYEYADVNKLVIPNNGVLYVNAAATGNNTGNSWEHALTNLQDALNIPCNNVSQIWVAKGIYKPTEGTNRNISFVMKNGVAIYGGFAGTETELSERNLAGAPSILSGEIQGDSDPLNNTNSLINNANIDASAVLDGFTIRGGAATIAGGGMLNNNASPTIRNCIFQSNSAVFNGGAVRNNSSSPVFTNCLFYGNTGTGNGGVIFNAESSPTFVNCTFANNTASGGVVFFSQANSALTLTNCIVWGNTGTAQISNTGTSTNAVSYSIIQGGFTGTGNLNSNPLFVDEVSGNFQLLLCSPAINKGTAANAPDNDLLGASRPMHGIHDLGAYEYAGLGKLAIPNNGILYVNAAATGNNTGSSWEHALTHLQDALTSTCSNFSQIWVVKGTYKPTEGTDRNISFALKNGIALYGGFAGTETQLSQRNWFVNQTILSGDIGSPGSTQDNSYTIVEASNTNATAIIDGFTISNANASESGTINETLRSMNGGGMYMQNGSPTISNCHFKDNNVRFNGGGIYNISGSPTITNCIFSGNRAEWGGGLYNHVNASPELRNCLFYRNRSFSNGGAMLNNNSSKPVGIHCTFAGNIGVNGVAVANYNSAELALIGSIVWEDANALLQVNAPTPNIMYSLLKGGFAGEGNLDADPLFVNAATDNYQLQACSPAINAGLAWIGSLTYDILGNSRPAFGGFDMGAYERQTAQPQILYVDPTATGIGDGSSWTNAFTKLEAALSAIKNCGAANTIHIAKGTYTPPPPALAFIMDKLNAVVLGGYPSGGNGPRNAAVNPVIIKGNVQVLKSLQLDGVKVEKSDMVDLL